MSRSRKKNPYTSIVAGRSGESEKKDKEIWHRKLRRKVRELLKLDKEYIPDVKEISDVWCMSKDDRQRVDEDKYLRK